jgi:hypothetical protein
MSVTGRRPRGTGSRTYRDATITRQTRDNLADLLKWMEADPPVLGAWIFAVRDVIERWDANEATQVRL